MTNFDAPKPVDPKQSLEEMYSILDNAPSEEGVDWLFELMSHHGYVNVDKISPQRVQNLVKIVDLALNDKRAGISITTTYKVMGETKSIEETFAEKLSSLKRLAQRYLG